MDGETDDELLSAADSGMYTSKKRNKESRLSEQPLPS
jgi:hypothetical protein